MFKCFPETGMKYVAKINCISARFVCFCSHFRTCIFDVNGWLPCQGSKHHKVIAHSLIHTLPRKKNFPGYWFWLIGSHNNRHTFFSFYLCDTNFSKLLFFGIVFFVCFVVVIDTCRMCMLDILQIVFNGKLPVLRIFSTLFTN